MSIRPEVLCGNSIKLVPTLGKFDFIFADPPFNIGQQYNDSRADFSKFTRRWIEVCWDALRSRGVLALHGNDSLAAMYVRTAARLKMRRVAWVIWHYRFGQCGRSNWINAHCHCLIFAKSRNHTWNAKSVLVPSDRATIYADKRIHETESGGTRVPGTVWGVPSDGRNWGRVQGNNRERRKGHPNQLPEKYLRRLIRAYTNRGDRILDPFGGSGTTAVVAGALKRRCVTIDISEENCDSIRDRIKKGACTHSKGRGSIETV
jgi:DNA modification methylase